MRLVRAAGGTPRDREPGAALELERAKLARDAGDLPRAIEHLGRALGLVEDAATPRSERALEIVRELARATIDAGRYADAERWRLREIELCAGREDTAVATALLDLGIARVQQARAAEALEPLRRAARIAERHEGADGLGVGNCLAWLALACQQGGTREEGESAARRALAIWERTKGSNHPEVRALAGTLAELTGPAFDVANGTNLAAAWQAQMSGVTPYGAGQGSLFSGND